MENASSQYCVRISFLNYSLVDNTVLLIIVCFVVFVVFRCCWYSPEEVQRFIKISMWQVCFLELEALCFCISYLHAVVVFFILMLLLLLLLLFLPFSLDITLSWMVDSKDLMHWPSFLLQISATMFLPSYQHFWGIGGDVVLDVVVVSAASTAVADYSPKRTKYYLVLLPQIGTTMILYFTINIIMSKPNVFGTSLIQKQHKKVKFVPENRNSTLLYVLYIISKRIFD